VSDNDGKSPGEGPERNPDGTYYKSQGFARASWGCGIVFQASAGRFLN
jgi:hypothetical protein